MIKSLVLSAHVALAAVAATAGPAPVSAPLLAYDYIIVGGGTAGVAVAARLSEGLPDAKIIVIEAGPAALEDETINVPGLKGQLLGGKYDWSFPTVPQKGLKNRVVMNPRGKVLGGSSAINFITWDRASAPEFDQWAEVGNPGWGWKEMEAAMEKAESFFGGPPGSGTKGPIDVLFNRNSPDALLDTYVPTMGKHGVPRNEDSLQGNSIGVGEQPANIDPVSYNRSYSANAYLPISKSNLKVLTDTQVAKVNLRKKGTLEQATGITLVNGTIIQARKEVILSAGAVQSPNLLELSGIGQAGVLKAAKIPQLIDLPGVGENYQEHLRVQTNFVLKDNFVTIDELRSNTTFAAEQWQRRLRNETSFYDDVAYRMAFLNWNHVTGGNDTSLTSLARKVVGNSKDVGLRKKLEQLANPKIPQAELIFSTGYTGFGGYPPVGSPLYGRNFVSLIGGLMHPLGRGNVHIDPANPVLGKPVIDPKMLDSEYDIQGLVEILKFARKVANTEPMKSLWETEYEPGTELVKTDKEWREYVVNTTLTIFHPMGTAAMLPRRDGGVVDSRLVVYGTENLRVVDASIVPVQVSGHPQTAVYGIAERGAEIIIADAKRG
ncbi:putative GMC oxidoreductase [Podospora australis]|uniref:GMC oxidoreductase n=1 Tax=Podospora australis TaxID=1536484 RepID=A0AAN6WT70_9PEZI|nr:putative GMC oxidoreductase [Podospora australis]